MTFTKTRISEFGGRDINENMYYKTQNLGELLANVRDLPEVLDGEIIAGDAAEVDVLTNLQQ